MEGKIRILIIDDEKQFCEIVKMNLELSGKYAVFMAYSGPDGVKIAKEVKPHAILLDIVLPKMDGLDVLKKLKKDSKTMNIPVIMLSAKGDDESKIKTNKLYSSYYITKPVSDTDLIDKIEWVLGVSGKQK